MKFVIAILLCYTIASAIAADEHRAKMKLKDGERGKRNLEYSISHNYPIGSNYRLERRIANIPNFQFPSRFPSYYPPGPRPYIPNGKRGRPHSVPPYAVQMEPLVQYSQRDPLYDTNKLPLSGDGNNDLSKPDDLLTENNHLSENIYGQQQNSYGPSYHHSQEPVYYQKEPEPIIEIIIKESNVTLPPVPVPTLPPKKKEPVQVFYVKYKKNPNGYGKDSVIYDKPIPALTPHVEESEEPQLDQPVQEYVTAAPPATTTIRTIIRPDSETFIGTSGIRVTFGSEHKHEKPSLEGHEESAPQPAVIFPQNNQQFSQPPTGAFPPNFNPPVNFNQQNFNNRNNQYHPVHHQQVRQFQNQQRAPLPPANHRPPFQPQQFPPRPLGPPPPQHRPFNQPPQFTPNHHFPQNPPPNAQNNHFPPPNHQFHHQFPPTQFTSHSFQHNFPPHQAPKQQFSQLVNHRPHTHFPIVQQLPQSNPSQFNSKPLTQPQLPKPTQNVQFNQAQHQRNNQQQNFQFNNHQLNAQQHQQTINHHQQQNQQQLGHIIPPGGELLKSVPRFEQHISVNTDPSQLNQATKPQALPQAQPQFNQFNHAQASQNIQQFNRQQQLQSLQLQQQLQHDQQQRNLQIQQQLQQQQQTNLSPQEFQKQVQEQFQQFPQNFAQLSHIQNKQSHQQSTPQPQEKIQSTQQPQSQAQNYFLQNLQNQQKSIQAYYQNQNNYSSPPSSTTTTTPQPTTTSKSVDKSEKKLPPNIQLPDEVPDDLREQLLSSGILNNAQISILDYDKVGDIPIDALPPDQLANFYGAGGAQQLAASERKETIIKPTENLKTYNQELEAESSEIDEVTKSTVEMKVVHYDSETQEGKAVQESYVRDDATQVDPVVLNDNKYNRYLPLKVSGINFPIPDVPELKGRNITSVVVLAPVDYEYQPSEHHSERTVRDIEGDIKDVRLLAGEALQELIKKPTKENYKRWLERENQTSSDKQSVVLLVTGSPENDSKEIFMYDVGTKTVSRLSGELSSAFVEAAESNADDPIPSESEVYENRTKLQNISNTGTSEVLEDFANISANSETNNRLNSGYRKTA